MTKTTWMNQGDTTQILPRNNRLLFLVGGAIFIATIFYLIVMAMRGNTQMYMIVDEFYAEQSRLPDRDVHIVGRIIGDSIEFTQVDAITPRLEFDIVDNMQKPVQRLHIVVLNEPQPELLLHGTNALVEGQMDSSDVFIVNCGGLLIKSPTRYETIESMR